MTVDPLGILDVDPLNILGSDPLSIIGRQEEIKKVQPAMEEFTQPFEIDTATGAPIREYAPEQPKLRGPQYPIPKELEEPGLEVPVYDPIDLGIDIFTAGTTAMGRAAIKQGLPAFGKVAVKEATIGAGVGAGMAVVDELGGGEISKILAGLGGGIATKSAIDATRQGIIRILSKQGVKDAPKVADDIVKGYIAKSLDNADTPQAAEALHKQYMEGISDLPENERLGYEQWWEDVLNIREKKRLGTAIPIEGKPKLLEERQLIKSPRKGFEKTAPDLARPEAPELIQPAGKDFIETAAERVGGKPISLDDPLGIIKAVKEAKLRPITDIAKDLNTALGARGAIGDADLTAGQKAAYKRLSGDLDVIKKNAAKTGKTVEKYLKDLNFDPDIITKLTREAELPKYAGSINIERQDIPEVSKRVELDVVKGKEKIGREEIAKRTERIFNKPGGITATYKRLKEITHGKLTADIDAAREYNAGAATQLLKQFDDLKTGKVDSSTFNKQFQSWTDGILNTTADASSEIGRALEAHKRIVGPERIAKIAGKITKELNPRQFEEIKEATKLLSEGKLTKEHLNRLEKVLPDPKMQDYLLEFWYNSILSGPPTHLVNAISNTGWQMFQLPHKALASGVDKIWSTVTGAARTRYLNEIIPMFSGYRTGFKRGRIAAGEMLRHGKISDFETKWAQEMGSSIGAFERSPNKVLRKAAPYITAPTRALRAMDLWANSMAYDARIQSIARRASNEKGLKGKARTNFEENFLKNPPGKAHIEAVEQAKYSTFMDDPDPLTAQLIRLREVVPFGAGRFVVPFVNTISNLTKRGLEITPGIGLVKEGISRGMGRGKNPSEVIAKQIEGAVIAFYIFDKIGKGEITGEMPRSEAEREAWYRQNKKPWAIKFGDTWLQYRRIEPFNTAIASTAIFYDKILNAKDDETATDAFANASRSIFQNLIDSSYLQGVGKIFDKYSRELPIFNPRFFASWVPYSSFWRSMNRAHEVIVKGETTAKARKKAPWLTAFDETTVGIASKIYGEEPPEKLNLWGDKSVLPGGVFRQWLPYKWSKETIDPVEKALEEVGFYPASPKQTTIHKGEKIKIPDSMYMKWAIDYGSQLKDDFSELIQKDSYKNSTQERKLKRLEKRRNKRYYSTKRKMLRELRKTND